MGPYGILVVSPPSVDPIIYVFATLLIVAFIAILICGPVADVATDRISPKLGDVRFPFISGMRGSNISIAEFVPY